MDDWNQAEQRVELAQRLYETGDFSKAARELRSAIAVNPYNPSWHFNLALTLDALGDYAHAVAAYRRALELEPDDVEVINGLGVDQTRLGHYRDALDCFERIEKLDPSFEPAYCNRIVTYSEMGDHESAELMFYLARQIKDECPLCLYNLANSLYERQQFGKAIACWESVLKLDPEHCDVHARLAESHWSLGEFAKARECYIAQLREEPGDYETLLDLGELLLEMGELDDAGEKFRRVLEQAPEHVGAHFGLAELAFKRDQMDIAEKQLRLVLRLDKHYPGVHQKLGEVLLRKGKLTVAGVHLLAELRQPGQDAESLMELGQLLLEARKFRQANEALRKLVALEPENAAAHHSLAVSYFLMHDLDAGIRHCRRALKHRPNYALALYNLSLAHMQKGQMSRARRYASRAIVAAPTDKNIHTLAAQLGLNGFWQSVKAALRHPLHNLARRFRHGGPDKA